MVAGLTATALTAGAAAPVVAAGVGTAAASTAGAAAGAVAAGTGAAATGAAIGSTALVTTPTIIGGILSGPIGWAILGAAGGGTNSLTYDCWKPVLRDMSKEPSTGKLLKDIIVDARISSVQGRLDEDSQLQDLVLGNIWGEQFGIQFYQINAVNQLVAHAERIN